VLVNTGAVTGQTERKVVWIKRPAGDPIAVPDSGGWMEATWGGLHDPAFTVYPCPPDEPCPDCPPVPDVSEIVEHRDSEWREWALEGSPGQRERSTMAEQE
jgi:hypothetical protein